MGEYFKPLRRMVGVVTLLMACLTNAAGEEKPSDRVQKTNAQPQPVNPHRILTAARIREARRRYQQLSQEMPKPISHHSVSNCQHLEFFDRNRLIAIVESERKRTVIRLDPSSEQLSDRYGGCKNLKWIP